VRSARRSPRRLPLTPNLTRVDDDRYCDNGTYEDGGKEWQYPNQQNDNNSDVQQRGLDALGKFLGTDRDELPPDAIVRELERRDYYDISRPVLNGRVYQVYAVDAGGQDVELFIDANNGQIVKSDTRASARVGMIGMQERWRFAEKSRSVGEKTRESEQSWERALKRSSHEGLRQAGSEEMQWIGDIAPFEPGRDALGDPVEGFEEGDRSTPARAVEAARQGLPVRLWTAVIAGALIGSLLGLVATPATRQD
jgi:hypothetical protein